MKKLLLDRELIKKSYTYRSKRTGIIIFNIIFGVFSVPLSLVIFSCLAEQPLDSGLKDMSMVSIIVFIIYAIIMSSILIKRHKLLKNSENYIVTNADVTEFEIYSRSAGKYGSRLMVSLTLGFCTESHRYITRNVSVGLSRSITKNTGLEIKNILVAYDEKTDRFLILDNIDLKVNCDFSYDEDPFIDFK